MPETETSGNGIETLSDRKLLEHIWARIENVSGQISMLQHSVDHIDTGVHGVTRFIDEHMPLLKRFTDPGAAARSFLGARKPKGKAVTGDGR